MSKTVDERVLEMKFDNKQFESGVSTTMSTLDKLKQKLNLKGASQGLESVNSAANKCNMSGLSNAVESVHAKFSALQVMGVTALANITNSAVDAGKKIASALTIDPIKDGFQEYETQINAVQTILANTQKEHTNVDQVNAALDKLNKYADDTIYNFTEMTRNIGTFTAAGVKLDTSVDAIKGIANLAAVSGSTSQQASTAMYQLSQALAAGKVNLQDWNSVVNAGMGGQVFQDALVRTSEHLKTGAKEAIKTSGTFRESLTKSGWLTTEVLTETLKQISGAYSEADLVAQGYTKDQAKEIVKLGKTATDAATKVKTFSQLIDTLKEALGSGWTESWRIIIGDFEEAKELWTEVSNVLGDAINKSAESRNKMLQDWSDLGGRKDLIESFKNIFEGLVSVITPIRDAFREIFPPTTGKQLAEITKGFKEFTSHLKVSDETAEKIKSTFKGLFSIVKMVFNVIKSLASGAMNIIGSFSGLGDFVLDITSRIGDFVSGLQQGAEQSNIFGSVIDNLSNVLSGGVEALTSFGQNGLDKLSSAFEWIGEIASKVGNVLKNVFSGIGKNLSNVFDGFNLDSILDVFNSGVLAALLLSVRKFVKGLTEATDLKSLSFFDSIKEFADDIKGNISGTLDAVRGSMEAWQNNLKADILLKLAAAIAILAASLVILASVDKDRLTDALGGITTLFIELMGAMALLTKMSFDPTQLVAMGTMLAMATAILILASALKKISSLNPDEITKGVLGIAGLAVVLVVATRALSGVEGMALKGAIAMVVFAAAIKILASVCKDLSELSLEQIGTGLLGVAALVTMVGIFLKTAKIQPGIFKASLGILSLAIALKVLASVCKDFGSMDWETMGRGLAGIAASLAAFVLFSHLIDTKGLIKAGIGIAVISGALYLLVPNIERLSKLSWDEVGRGLVAIGGSLLALSLMVKGLKGKDLWALAAVMPAISSSLQIIASAFEKFKDMSWEQIVRGLAAVGGSILALVVAIKFLPEKDLWQTAAALPAITSALLVIAEGMEKLGNLSWEQIAKGLVSLSVSLAVLIATTKLMDKHISSSVGLLILATTLVVLASAISIIGKTGVMGAAAALLAIAGTLTAVGLATKILQPLIPSIFALSASIATLGGSFIVLGVGMAALGVGMASFMSGFIAMILTLKSVDIGTIVGGLVALAGVFVVIGVAAKLLQPIVPSILAVAGSVTLLSLSVLAVSVAISLLVTSLTVLAAVGEEQANSIVNTLKALILGITEMIPEIIDSLIESAKTVILGLLQAITEIAPEIADSLLKILTEVVKSLSEYIPQIVGFLIDFVIKIFNVLASRVGEIVGAISNFLKALWDAIMQQIGEVDPSTILQTILTIGVIGVLMGALGMILPLIPKAMLAVVGIGVVMAELTLVIAAIGGLAQIPGLQWLVSEGGNLLQALGTAIGQFVGGIIGGVAEGATSTLPQVASNLSSFMTNVQPFINGAKQIDESAMAGVKSLAETILILTAADLLNAITSFVSGGSSLSDFGKQLVPFGEAMMAYSQTVTGIDANAIKSSAEAGKALGELANSIPKEGGLAQAIFGETPNMEEFGSQMVAFGKAMMAYSQSVSGIDAGAIRSSAEAGRALSDLANSLPKEGGLSQAIFGETTDFATFGTQLKSFGKAICSYSKSVVDLDAEPISKSVTAAQSIVKLANALPDDPGWIDSIFGGKDDLSGFGDKLKSFGDALGKYSSSIGEIDIGKMNSSVEAANKIKKLALSLKDFDSSGIDNFKIKDLGTKLKDYSDKLGEVNSGAVSSSVSTIKTLIKSINSMKSLDSSGIGKFKKAVESLSKVDLSSVADKFSGSTAKFTNIGSSLTKALSSGFKSGGTSFVNAASSVMSSATKAVSGKSGAFKSAGAAAGKALKSGISSSATQMTSAFTKSMSGMLNAVKSKTSAFASAGSQLSAKFKSGITKGTSGAVSAVKSMVNKCKAAASGNKSKFVSAGKACADGFASGISQNSYKAAAKAKAMASAAASAAKKALDINSPSKVFRKIGKSVPEGFAQGIGKLGHLVRNSATGMARNAVSGTTKALTTLNAAVNSMDVNAQPVITPVLDMSNVNGVIDQGLSIGTTMNLNAISASMRRRAQNGTNADVVSAIDKLRSEVRDLEKPSYNINGITYDNGSQISEAIETLVRAAIVERRV